MNMDEIYKKALHKAMGGQSAAEEFILDYCGRLPAPPLIGEARHIGIEIECYGPASTQQVAATLLALDLEKYVDVDEDGSIEGDGPGDMDYEFQVLVTEANLDEILNKLKTVFKICCLKVNESCGLHVHLDMRHRNKHRCYERLLKFQDLLFGMVARPRWYSEYCRFTNRITEGDKYVAINNQTDYDTIEVRLHQGTLDVNKIKQWVTLLTKIIDHGGTPVKDKKSATKWAKRHKLDKYVDKTFKQSWFKAKPGALRKAEECSGYY
jgi:hypothetical protein